MVLNNIKTRPFKSRPQYVMQVREENMLRQRKKKKTNVVEKRNIFRLCISHKENT